MVYLKIQFKVLPSLNEEAGELNFYDKVSGSRIEVAASRIWSQVSNK